MAKRRKRTFKDGVPLHVYTKGRNSFAMFYTVEDYILYFTMYSVYSDRYEIRTIAFTPMINHTHEVCYARSLAKLSKFRQTLEGKFAWEHNLARGRKGSVIKSNFGSAPKYVGKILKSSIAYVNNNPVAGHIKTKAIDYKWNCLAYYNNKNPFSEKITLRTANQRLRNALKIVDSFREEGKWLGYAAQNMIFRGLEEYEKLQVIDYIIYTYNFLDYDGAISFYGSWENMLIAINSNSGSENDLPEDWEDYSKYVDMMRACARNGISLKCVNFDDMPLPELSRLLDLLSRETDALLKQILKFLHIRPFNYDRDWMLGIPA